MTELIDPPPETPLRSRAAFGIRWGAIDQGAQFVVRLAAIVVLAHYLTPHDLGVMAIASIVLSLGSLAIGLGVSDALVQRRSLDRTFVDVAFTISSATGVLVMVIVIAASSWIADLFNEPRVTGVLLAVSVIFALSGLERTPNDVLIRAMRFRDFYISSTIGTFLSVVVGIAIAVAGGGVWALVAMRIRTMSAPPRYRELEEEIEKVRKDKEEAIENQEFEKAASLRDKERKLTQKKRELEENWRENENGDQPEIGEDEIADIVSMTSGCSSESAFWRHDSSSSRFFCVSLRSLSRSDAAFSNSWFSIAASLSLRTLSISSSSSR